MFTAAQIDAYQRDGYIVLPSLFNVEDVSLWKAKLQKKLATENRLDEPSGVRVWMRDEMDPVTAANVQSAPLIQALTQLIGPEIEFLSVKAVFKNAKTSFNSPWHQDWHYWQGSPKISVWIALDDATPENGCLRLVPGSHRSVVEMEDIDDGKGFNRRIHEEALMDRPIETVPIAAGDAIFFHDLALHASCPNINGQDRWTTIATYRSSREVDESTVWQKSICLNSGAVD